MAENKKEKYPVVWIEADKKRDGETEFEFKLRLLKSIYGPFEYDFGTDFEV